MGQTRRKYTIEFKIEAVRLVEDISLAALMWLVRWASTTACCGAGVSNMVAIVPSLT